MLDPNTESRVAALRGFLRACRARAPGVAGHERAVRQRDVAAAAGISLSLYKRLESGNAGAVRMDTLARVASALRLQPSEQAHLVALARPDLATLGQRIALRNRPADRLRRLRLVSRAMSRAPSVEAACRAAAGSIPALLGGDVTAYLLLPAGPDRLRVAFHFGAALPQDRVLLERTFRVRATLRQGRTVMLRHQRMLRPTTRGLSARRVEGITCVPVRAGGELVAALGISSSLDGHDARLARALVETVTALLEAAVASIERSR
jgi:DNA-binding Xre family transcriptional regulator